MSDANDFLREIQCAFLVEAHDHLESLESLFINFEKNPDDTRIVEEIFRVMHTIKGSGRSAGFEHLGHVAHVIENVLVRIQKREIGVTHAVVDVLLRANDLLCNYLKTLADDLTAQVDSRDIEAELAGVILTAPPPNATVFERATAGDIIFMDQDTEGVPTEVEVTTKAIQAAPIPMVPTLLVAESQDESFSPHESSAQPGGGGGVQNEFLRVPLQKIDILLNNFGEQVILQSALEQLKEQFQNEQASNLITQLGKVTYELQQTAMSLRMINLKSLFNKINRTVRDTANAVNKTVIFESAGESTELDKTIVDDISSVITHLVRNAVDHGIESPEERRLAGKNPEGLIRADAFHEGGFFYLKIMDDGKGLDREKILQKAIAKGLAKPGVDLKDEDVFALIFVSGFSTKDQATDISGRGVGMDAVKATVERVRGQIMVSSISGQGCTITMKLPLSMAIFNGMVFEVGERKYVVPSSRIKDIERFDASEPRAIDGVERVLQRKGLTFPLISLNHLLRTKGVTTATTLVSQARRIAFLVENQGQTIGLEVDEIIGQQRIVQKKLGKEVADIHGVSGGAILGDGGIALILNLDQLLSHRTHH